ncbi:hypothetical protein ASG32_31980 [Methylobacterium sp. Leaf361]|uniref:DUF6894 family protein n=1 Tax=Methylobacterium sp. Leaf361 TaxID=1736352 RepID=UPI0007012BEF|nr:hypothetical protein [Methylobacterium sp. Leaf361]KQS47170.1 hypothetical protein ASG32_31980 [Methylobacterium sp. Leaf361]
MSRYFISTDDHVEVMDEEGVEVPSRDALRELLRLTLTAILRDEGRRTGVDEFTAKAFDERGCLVMKARASFSITDQ